MQRRELRGRRGRAARTRAAPLSPRDRIARRWLPRLVVALARVTGPARLRAQLARAMGRRGRVELYVAFDDPCSAVALVDLDARIAGRRVDLVVRPVVARGIADDPAVEAKRRHAVVDAQRLARRRGLTLHTSRPRTPGETAFLAAWVDDDADPALARAFSVAAARRLWLDPGAPADVEREHFAALWRTLAGREPPVVAEGAELVADRMMPRRALYDTPCAVVAGRRFFAHDRGAQIAAWLDELGWSVTA